MQEMLQAISTVGFPIVVAGYMLIKFDNTIKEHTKVLQAVVERLEGGKL
jgi:YvrJ protein family